MPGTVVSLPEVRANVTALMERGLSGCGTATTLGLSLEGHGGSVRLFTNEDDEESFCCQMLEELQGHDLGGFVIEEIENWNHGEGPLQVEGAEPHSQDGEEAGDYPEYRAIFGTLMETAKAWLSRPEMAGRLPGRIIFGEGPVICDEVIWEIPGGRPLPPPPAHEVAPRVEGFDPASLKGLRIYQFGRHERKYAQLYFHSDPKFDEGTKAASWAHNAQAKAFNPPGTRRQGDLAATSMLQGVIALNPASPHAPALREWFGPETEYLPVADEFARSWEVINVLRIAPLLDPVTTRFDSLRGRRTGISRCEFDAEKVHAFGMRPFRLDECPRSGIFIPETDGEESFRQFCMRSGIRGLRWKLIWCEDREFLACQLAEFDRLVRQRLTRLYGSADIHPANIECLYGRNVELWKLAKDSPSADDLRGKEGYLCDEIPFGLATLREMESKGGGELAIYGPAV